MSAEEICAVILAGGQSRRMGHNKALIDIDGCPLIQTLAQRLTPLTRHIFIAANSPDAYRFLQLPIVPDRFPNQGPLAGLHAVMSEHIYMCYLVVACDLPNLSTDLLRRIIAAAGLEKTTAEAATKRPMKFDAVIPRSRDGLAHPLSAAYRRTCLPAIENALKTKANKVIETFLGNGLVIRWIEQGDGAFIDNDLVNINTPEDLRQFRLSPP